MSQWQCTVHGAAVSLGAVGGYCGACQREQVSGRLSRLNQERTPVRWLVIAHRPGYITRVHPWFNWTVCFYLQSKVYVKDISLHEICLDFMV